MTSRDRGKRARRQENAPISIWTFLGVMLLVYAVVLLLGLVYPIPKGLTMVTSVHLNLLWALVLAAAGVSLVLAGVRSRER